MKIETVEASVWYNEEETQATGYAVINGAPDKVMFTFFGNKFEDGECEGTRIRLQRTKQPVTGITARLALPYEADNSDGWVLTITAEGEQPVAVKLKPDPASHFEDGTRNFKRPVGSGSYTARGLNFFDWLEEAPKEDKPIIRKGATASLIRNMINDPSEHTGTYNDTNGIFRVLKRGNK